MHSAGPGCRRRAARTATRQLRPQPPTASVCRLGQGDPAQPCAARRDHRPPALHGCASDRQLRLSYRTRARPCAACARPARLVPEVAVVLAARAYEPLRPAARPPRRLHGARPRSCQHRPTPLAPAHVDALVLIDDGPEPTRRPRLAGVAGLAERRDGPRGQRLQATATSRIRPGPERAREQLGRSDPARLDHLPPARAIARP